MMVYDGETTSPTLLARARDWRDRPAWRDLFLRYDALVHRWCRSQSLDDSAADEVRQRVWIELADRIRSFRYDPRRSFRGWLRELCRYRSIDYLRERQREQLQAGPLDDEVIYRVSLVDEFPSPSRLESEPGDPISEDLVEAVATAQAAVRNRVSPTTWDVFWQIAIEEVPIKEVATSHHMSYAAAFEAYRRVDRMLREEGRRRRTIPTDPDPIDGR